MKKFLAVIISICMASFGAIALSACGGSSNNLEGKDFVVGFDAEYPPYGYMDKDGSYTGFDLDLAQEVCSRNGWNYSATPIDWDSKDQMLESGSITCIWNGFTMQGREGQYTFSEPYMINKQVVVTKANSSIKSLSDLSGKVVITQKGSAAASLLQAGGDQEKLAKTFKKLDTVADYNSAFMQLESGAVDAVACDLSIAAYQISANKDAYKQLDKALSEESYAVGFLLNGDNSQEFADTVSSTLKEMYEDGTVEKLVSKYADQGMSIDNWLIK